MWTTRPLATVSTRWPRADAENTYNLTVIEPSFSKDPWYADTDNPSMQYETFMTTQLEPWARATLSTSGHEQSWLIGFSKSGIGAQDLILKHPDLFTLAASWDFPAEMSASTEFGDSAVGYGTDANFQAKYRLTQRVRRGSQGAIPNQQHGSGSAGTTVPDRHLRL